MSWTYDETTLATNAVHRVRLKLGDLDPNDPQLQDEEIQLLLNQQSSEAGAVAAAARLLAARYSRSVDKWVGDLKILASQRARAYRELAENTLAGSTMAYGTPFAGGIRVSSKEDIEANDDLVVPSFRRDMHDNLESGGSE